MTKNNIAITVKGLTKSYNGTPVLKGIDFDVKRGTMLALLGPNGAGKTTTVRILSTLLGYDKGTVIVEGHDVKHDADAVRSVIGLTGQSAAVDELLTGRENLVMMGRLYRLTTRSAKNRATELLKDFDLEDAADRTAKTYSGGMRRRLDLAVSLIAAPPIVFLDEPTTGLDPRSRIAMWDVIKKLMKDGTTILLTTQYLEEADQLADNIILINDGTVAAQGSPKQLKQSIGSDKLEFTFTDKTMYKKAKKALSSQEIEADDDQQQLIISIEDSNKDVRTTLETLDKSSIEFATMALHKPSLDDVFLSITGKKETSNE